MGLLGKLSRKKQTEPETEQPKTELRIYLENLIEKAKEIDTGTVSISGFPVNPVAILPMVAKQISDEMLENIADLVVNVANDIQVIKRRREQLLIQRRRELLLIAEQSANETIEDFTEIQTQ